MQTHTTDLVTPQGETFETPENLVADSRLPPDKKAQLLEQWAADLEARLRASDENMPGTEPGEVGDLLRRVKNAQLHLANA